MPSHSFGSIITQGDDLTQIMRPIVNGDDGAILRRPPQRENNKVEEPPTLRLTGKGLTTFDYRYSVQVTKSFVYNPKPLEEIIRHFDIVEIFNKDDHSQSVEVEYTNKLETRKKSKGSKKKAKRDNEFAPFEIKTAEPGKEPDAKVIKANQKRENPDAKK